MTRCSHEARGAAGGAVQQACCWRGRPAPELVQQGYTTEEERSASGLTQVRLSIPP